MIGRKVRLFSLKNHDCKIVLTIFNMFLTFLNIVFVMSFLPEPQREKEQTMKNADRRLGFLQELLDSLRKPLLGITLLILFIVTLAFSTIPVIVPLLSIDFFNFSSLELSFVFIYIGLIQIVMQGFVINSLSRRFGDEKLIALGPVLMATGAFLMPIFQNVIIFFFTNSLLAVGFGIINTSIPAFLSKRISLNEQGSILGAASSVASIANIPGPLVIGFIYAFAGSFVPFLISTVMLALAFLIGCRVYSACKFLK